MEVVSQMEAWFRLSAEAVMDSVVFVFDPSSGRNCWSVSDPVSSHTYPEGAHIL